MYITQEKRIGVTLPLELWMKVREWCMRNDQSISDFIRHAAAEHYTKMTGDELPQFRVRPPGRPVDPDVFDASPIIPPPTRMRLALDDSERKPVDTRTPMDILKLAGQDQPKKAAEADNEF